MDNQTSYDDRILSSPITSFIDLLSRAAFFLCQGSIIAILIIVFSSIITRYFFNYVLEWSDEVVSYIFICSVFFGMAEIMRRREHISVDLLLSGISKRKYSFLELFILIVSLLWCIVMGWQAWAVVVNAFKYGITSSSLLRFPLYISYSFLSIGLTLLTLQILAQIRRTLSGIMNASSSPA